jgi:hypothetical protein
MTSELPQLNKGWKDKDKRRAALLSLFLHALFLLLIALYRSPEPEPLETYLVIDVGTPAFSETTTLAPAADAPAPQTAEPSVAAEEAGTPQAQTPPAAAPAPQPTPETTQAETPTPPAQTEAIAETETPPQPAPESQVAETPPQPEPTLEPEVVEEPTPAPEVAQAAPPVETALPEAPEAVATLPEIESPTPEPTAQAIALPTPTPEVEVSPAVSVATEASVQVASEQTLPLPQVNATVTEAEPVPQPQVQASVVEASPVPQPEVRASVTQAQAVPTPNVQASVAQAQTVPSPNVQANVAASQAIPLPSAQASVTASQTIPQPQAQARVTPSETEGTQASTAPSDSQAISDSGVSAEGEEGNSAQEIPNAVTATANAQGQRTSQDGGNASTSGQTTADPNASADNLGLAASPDGVGEGTGAPFAKTPYRENRDRPLTVMIDNTFGYPQAGLLEASMVVEMPVEGGSTRLMTVYDRIDPAKVGPVRSARDYFHALSASMDGILVHDGGSPQAMAAIERASVPTLNAYNNGPLFERGDGEAPYNLFSSGTSLRQAIAKLNLNKSRAVSGTIFRPEETAPAVSSLSVNYSGIYDSGFQYIEDLNQYRWVRNGDTAVDFSGEAVYAEAVVIASISVRELPDDPAGRLYIPLESSKATLYVRGKAIEGNWSPNGGVKFTTSLGEVVDLTPFKTWVLFTPTYADITQQ